MHDEVAGSWRELLAGIISSSSERQRIAGELRVNPVTLTRWVNGESSPRPQNLRQLLAALPQYREVLFSLIKREFPHFEAVLAENVGENGSATIPGEFYMRVLRTRASLPKSLLYMPLCDLILQQALKHLDPYRSGIGISVARCLPSLAGDSVRNLLTDMGRGSPPWLQNMEPEIMLLGAESLAGYVVITGRPFGIPDLYASDNRIPVSLGAWERSAAAAPIIFRGRIAGSLVVSSTQLDYFSPDRQELVSSYADLIALAFEPEQFFDPRHIHLRALPAQQVQQPYIAGFRSRVIETMRQAEERHQPLTVIHAEQLVWQTIVDELLLHQQVTVAGQ
ncbi:MAG TPA: GAF domain-containing protein [Ktedonobacteraceae bacterium]|nr:GAF domain-containing protein [Ktedonobacteraceae bacterium]